MTRILRFDIGSLSSDEDSRIDKAFVLKADVAEHKVISFAAGCRVICRTVGNYHERDHRLVVNGRVRYFTVQFCVSRQRVVQVFECNRIAGNGLDRILVLDADLADKRFDTAVAADIDIDAARRVSEIQCR